MTPVERAADALRRYEVAGKKLTLNDWDRISWSQQKRWLAKVQIVLDAVAGAPDWKGAVTQFALYNPAWGYCTNVVYPSDWAYDSAKAQAFDMAEEAEQAAMRNHWPTNVVSVVVLPDSEAPVSKLGVPERASS